MKLLVSACLLGEPCRYDGKSKPCEAVLRLREKCDLIPVCPEVLGGLPTPRVPAERQRDGSVIRADGADVSEEYAKGAAEALQIARENHCVGAILKEKSPSCGSGRIYNGSFTRTLTDGDGVCAELLKANGIYVLGESEAETGVSELCKGEGADGH